MRKGILILAIACMATTAMAGPRDWYAWTGEVSNDYLDVNNWRWANGLGFNHPASVAVLMASRNETGRATYPAALQQTANIADGGSYTQTYGGIEVDSGMDLNIYNGSSFTVNGSVSGNGLGTDSLLDSTIVPAASTGYWEGNFLQSNVHVYGGGTFTTGGFSGGIMTRVSSPLRPGKPAGIYRYTGNQGVFVEGLAHVNITGSYTIGSQSSAGEGGGHFTLKGYDPGTTVSIGGNMNLYPAKIVNQIESYNNDISGSAPARLEIILDSSNNGGLFSTASVAGNLFIDAPSGNKTSPVQINVTKAGYAATPGQKFQIIDALALTGALTTDKGWDTDFVVDGTTFQLHQTGVNGPGVYLEVMPEPATMTLLVLGGVGLIARKRR